MIFDKSKVYTAVNADELKENSVVFVANDLYSLMKKVEMSEGFETLIGVDEPSNKNRFMITNPDNTIAYYNLAYLISEPKEKPEYRPFSSTDKVDLVGRKIVYKKNDTCKAIILWQNGSQCTLRIAKEQMFFSDLLENWVFDDGSACGVKLED